MLVSHTLQPAYAFPSADCSPFRLGVARYAVDGTESNLLDINV